ncbi:MAG: PD-(D/E)XK nuclease domain-containing protein, partial [Thermodesulfovibrionales bacterium]|nr:PD-(D/E)XK nuclease domain-containing protein [Thermodesulfovibrionales bacterium]
DYIEVENLLFQTGYLTILEARQMELGIFYKLSYPNMEVKRSLNEYILKYYSSDSVGVTNKRLRLYEVLKGAKIEEIRDIMQSHFASIPHDWYRNNDIANYEGYYASVFYSYFASLGLDIRVEDATNHGKVDMTVLMNDKVLIFEFKVVDLIKDNTSALEQIKKKNYHEKYRLKNLPIYLIGIEFNSVEKNILNYEWMQV